MHDFRHAAQLAIRKINLFMNVERGCRLHYNRDLEVDDMTIDDEDENSLEM